MIINGISNAVIAIISFNYGARLKKRIEECIKLTLIVSIIIMLGGTFIFILFPQQLISIFNADKKTFEISIKALKICSLSFICSAINIQTCSFLQALDGNKQSLFLSLLRQFILLVPLIYLISIYRGLDAIWWSFPISEAIVAMLSLKLLFHIKQKINNI